MDKTNRYGITYDMVSCEMIPYASIPNTNAQGFIEKLPNQVIRLISS